MDLSEILVKAYNIGQGLYEAERARRQSKQRSSELKELSNKIASAHTEGALLGPPEGGARDNTQVAEKAPKNVLQSVSEGTACVPCVSDHFSTCAGLISDEAVRMARRHGIEYQEVIQRVLACSDQLNAMERDDLAVDKIQGLPEWEKELAIYAQNKGAEIRHLLNNISSVEDLERAAIEIKQARNYIGSEWHKRRLASMGTEEMKSIAQRAEAIRAKLGQEQPELTLEDAKRLAGEQASKEVEAKWQSQERK
jgi:hypothetical protein